ncbi:MAG: alpha/beta hydrolase domain-containing protein, partial [Solirubrobacterales bacterium]
MAGVMALIASAAVAGQARAEYDAVPTPDVTGPIAVTQDPESYPFLATEIDLSRYGYVEQEFFISGNAYRYDLSGDLGEDGIRIETGGPHGNGTYPFQPRIVVRRPADPADANGTVVAEWNNVTATRDIEWNWLGDPEFMLRNGYTFVGVTAQNVGLLGLRSFDSDRYGDVEGRWDTSMAINPLGPNDPALDDLSYDIYGAALKAIRGAGTGEDPLGGIEAETVIASGESQSCGR